MIGGRALALRAGGVIAATVAAAIALALLLAFLKFDQRLLDVTVARLGLVVEDVRRQSETGLALGLELAELEDLTGVLQRAARVRDVLRIELWDERGRALFSSDPGHFGMQADASGMSNDASGRFRRRIRGSELLLTAPLRNGFGQLVGDVAVYASLAGPQASLAGVRHELLSSSTPVVLAALLATLAAVMLTVRWSGAARRGGGDDGLDANAEQLHQTLEPRLAAALASAAGELAEQKNISAAGELAEQKNISAAGELAEQETRHE